MTQRLLLIPLLLLAVSPVLRAQTPSPKSPWDTVAQAGLTLTRGNSETLVANGGISTAKRWSRSDFSSSLFLTYSTDRDRRTADLLRAFGQYNHTLSERWYAGVRLEGLRDGVADVDYRFTLSPLAGWYAFKSKDFFLRAETGPSAAVIESVSGINREYLVWRAAERIEWRISSIANLWQSVELLQPTDNVENFLLNGELGFNAAITERIGIQPKILATFDNEPARGRKKHDLRWITSLTYRF